MIQENVQIIKILHLIKYTGSQVTVMSKEESCVDVFPAATATKRPKVLWKTFKYVAVDIKINVNTTWKDAQYLLSGQGSGGRDGGRDGEGGGVAKEEREASVLRLAWISEIKPECCQDSWHSARSFSPGTTGGKGKSFCNKRFSGPFGFIVWNIFVPSKSDELRRNNFEFYIAVVWLTRGPVAGPSSATSRLHTTVLIGLTEDYWVYPIELLSLHVVLSLSSRNALDTLLKYQRLRNLHHA